MSRQVTSIRVDPVLWNRFKTAVQRETGQNKISHVLEGLTENYVKSKVVEETPIPRTARQTVAQLFGIDPFYMKYPDLIKRNVTIDYPRVYFEALDNNGIRIHLFKSQKEHWEAIGSKDGKTLNLEKVVSLFKYVGKEYEYIKGKRWLPDPDEYKDIMGDEPRFYISDWTLADHISERIDKAETKTHWSIILKEIIEADPYTIEHEPSKYEEVTKVEYYFEEKAKDLFKLIKKLNKKHSIT